MPQRRFFRREVGERRAGKRRRVVLGAFHVHPLSGFRGLEDGIANVLGAEGVSKIGKGLGGTRIIEMLHELDSTVHERVFVSEAKAGDPPVSGVGVVAIGDMDAGPATGFTGDVMIEVREPVEIVEVPGD